ncbi:MAG: RagB/SusD family nutrient uptake outer membrane protein, partial [Bacteroidaceae bacterium]|nr:RagB/SusD family nutrient uptake outer membrane protein [Bacteroidaceae bacterium]
MKKILSIIILTGLMLSSCVDTELLPYNKTVDEDFWQTKSDVSSMVNGAYKSMLSTDLMTRLIVWGDFRSDELVLVNSISNSTTEALNEIYAANIQITNTYANWANLYSVINICNIVLEKSKAVIDIDPSYTEGDWKSDCAQMKALRSLCYFYLVRNFRDVPYSGEAFMNSSQNLLLPQSNPDSVLTCCINDLKEAETNIISAEAFNDWRRVGWFNKDGVDALLADIYLWRASIMKNNSDYEQAIFYSNKVIESKKAQHKTGPLELEEKEYPLKDGKDAYNSLFIEQNAEESILELQFDGSNNSNTALCQYYYKYANNNSTYGYLRAAAIFGMRGTNNVYEKNGDYRFVENVYKAGTSEESYDIRKLCTQTNWSVGNPASAGGRERETDRAFTNFRQNYIVYRLSDVMLMKAEAMVQLATDETDTLLRQAFNIVQAVNNRSIYEGSLASDSLKWGNYNTVDRMENLVLSERLRELCFEGKRWYDLLRYGYRRMTNVDYTTTLAQQ